MGEDNQQIEQIEINVEPEPSAAPDEAVDLATQALNEVRQLRQEEKDEWRENVMQHLTNLNTQISELMTRLPQPQPEPEPDPEPDPPSEDVLTVDESPTPVLPAKKKRKRRLRLK